MTTATLTNRISGKTCGVKLHTSKDGILYISSRQYESALGKLGHGPKSASTGFMVYDGVREYAYMDGDDAIESANAASQEYWSGQ